MAGYTGFTSGLVNNRTVLLPINLVRVSCYYFFKGDEPRRFQRLLNPVPRS